MAKILLLVDDDPAQSLWVEQALERLREVEVVHVEDGRAAVDYLRAHPAGTVRAPSVVFLDLMLPRLNGFEVLREFHRLANSSRIPVVVFTESIAQADIFLSYEFGANAFIVKPTAPGELQKVARLTAKFWLLSNVLPPVRGGGFES